MTDTFVDSLCYYRESVRQEDHMPKFIPRRRIDMTGQTFGAQTVEGYAGNDRHGQALWITRCVCGTVRNVPGAKLRTGEATSCGCLKPAKCAAANTKHGGSARGHMTTEYRTWSNMIDRCERRSNRQYADWGGRGIRVCARWRESFAVFLADMGRKPSPAHTIERINNDGNYESSNCRWATRKEQRANRRPPRCSTCGALSHNRRVCSRRGAS